MSELPEYELQPTFDAPRELEGRGSGYATMDELPVE
jgi:hypothetical protein